MKKYLIFSLLLIPLIFSGCATLGFGEFEGKSKVQGKGQAKGVAFTYKDPNATSVAVTGEFNNWNASANPLKKQDDAWKIVLPLKPGTYQYKFVVNGTDWKEDPNNPKTADDGYGGKNSVIVVGETKMTTETKKEEPITTGEFPVKFTYQPLTGGKHEIFLAGEFNNWSPTANPMKESNGIYEVTLHLKQGKYAYKFVVDENWVTDENAEEFIGDGFGGQNSIIYVGTKEDINALHKVEFRYRPNTTVTDVYLAGSFNDWNQKANKMEDQGTGLYSTTLLLNSGEYQYKFVVNGTDWITDESAEKFADDGFGGKNSVILVDDRFPKVTIAKKDGLMLTYGIPTEQSLETVNPLSETEIEFKTKAHSKDVESVYLWKDGKKIAMKKIAEEGTFDYFHKILKLKSKDEEFDYCFVYKDGNKEYFLLNGEITDKFDKSKLFHYSKNAVKPFFTPDWAKNGIIYQIFCDRFYNGNPANDPDFTEWYYKGVNEPPPHGEKLPPNKQYFHLVKDWYDISGLKKNPYRADGKPDWWSFYGGDIPGVHQKLDYLKDLGITIIYFNPLFEAKSNHKYDAADYKKLDPHFGTEDEFKSFIKDAHKSGIKVIIDCAFNHTGDTFFAFQDCIKNGPKSKYWHWYEWKKWPLPDPIPENFKPSDYYECWWNVGEMPDLDYDRSRPNPAENGIKDIKDAEPNWVVVNYILSVADYWIGKMDVDGFRLDVPNEVPFWFWKLFRHKVKSLKPDAYLVGEIWGNAIEWVNNNYFDAVMNYAYFKDPVMRFFCMRKCSAETFDRDLKPGLLNYPVQASQVMMNLIDSHDTFRYLESAGGDINKLKLAVLFEMTYVGIPHIWYGDEIGMMGAYDPDCRRPFNWKYKNNPEAVDLRNYYKKLISIRKQYPCLRTGTFKTLLTEGKIYSYLRNDENNSIIVVINNETTPQNITISIGLSDRNVTDLLSGKNFSIKDGKLEIELGGMSGAILK